MIDWKADVSDADFTYFYGSVGGVDREALGAALEAWWTKMCAQADQSEDWDFIVADLWVETGRLIGNVQRGDQAIGMDRGWRVCLTLEFAYQAIEAGDYEPEAYNEAIEAVWGHLYASIERPGVTAMLDALAAKNPFEIAVCEAGGDGDVAADCEGLDWT